MFFRCVLASLKRPFLSVSPSVGWSIILSSMLMKNGHQWILNDFDSAGRGRKEGRGRRKEEEEGGTRRKEGRGGMKRLKKL